MRMEEKNMDWSIRGLLNPVIVRSLIFGVNPIDMEFVLQQMEKKPLVNGKVLQNTWREEWGRKTRHFAVLAEQAEKKKNWLSAGQYYTLSAQCCYAAYLLNSEHIDKKREAYKELEHYYLCQLHCSKRRFETIFIPLKGEKGMPGYLHLPDERQFEGPYPCVILFAGYGSCKEELETMAKPLIERGIAALTLDQPGTGSALFDNNLKLGGSMLEHGFQKTIQFLETLDFIDNSRLGTYGLCMGGGYAYRVAAEFPKITCCAGLFPLFISMLGDKTIPRWMRNGEWPDFQKENASSQEFIEGMKIIADGSFHGDYMIVHSSYDNWMPLEKTNQIVDKSTGNINEVIIDDAPVYATEESVMHAMPVGEQMHWIKIQVADWFAEKLGVVQ